MFASKKRRIAPIDHARLIIRTLKKELHLRLKKMTRRIME
jgi:hypothetical protein